MNKNEFINALKELNIKITPLQLEKLETYYNLLIEENKKYNLTAITKKEDVYLKHFYDSLTLNKIINLDTFFKKSPFSLLLYIFWFILQILYNFFNEFYKFSKIY